MEGLGRLRGASKAQGHIHSQKPGIDLTGTVEQGNDFFLKSYTIHPICIFQPGIHGMRV
jgi:hypothetical protein